MSRTTDNKKEDPSWQKYMVAWHVDATGSHYVWAKDEEQAKEISENIFMADSDNSEIGDAQDIVDCQLVTEDQ